MKTKLRIVVPVALLIAALIGWALWPSRPDTWLGYVEGESLYMAAPVSGTLGARPVERGSRVRAGDPLFTLNPVSTDAEVARLQGEVEAARARLTNLQKSRQRAPELRVSVARQAAARAELVRAQKEYERIAVLAATTVSTLTRTAHIASTACAIAFMPLAALTPAGRSSVNSGS